jgi:two-component system, OmpR family, phosphate regulon response regulator PhoB
VGNVRLPSELPPLSPDGASVLDAPRSPSPAGGARLLSARRRARPPRRVLIVEREDQSTRVLGSRLTQAGFQVNTVRRGYDAQMEIARDPPQLVLLDWDVPRTTVVELLRRVREASSDERPRLIALASQAGEDHVVAGFEMGVDDYVTKPYSVAEVVARSRAVLRSLRSPRREARELRFHRLHLNTVSRVVSIGDPPAPLRDTDLVQLRTIELRLLEFLMRHPERAFERDVLLRRIWGRDPAATTRTVDLTVQRVRKALRAHGCEHYVETVRGVGYRLSAGAA